MRAIFYKHGHGSQIWHYHLTKPLDGCQNWFCYVEDIDLNVRELIRHGYEVWILNIHAEYAWIYAL